MEFDKIIIAISEQLLLNVKTGAATDSLEYSLLRLDVKDLTETLTTDNARKTFWINIYNAYFQILSAREKKTRPAIFRNKLVDIAGNKFSLDDIEHGILRKYRWKYSLGYLPQLFPSKLIKQLAVSSLDFRIHFALNCGAKSCPPIAFYKLDPIDKQLDLAALSFLQTETLIDEEKKIVTVTKLMQWFKGDFGGNDGTKNILSRYLKKNFSNYTIRFSHYSWESQLNNFLK
ncbi:MAG: DUF547 domain-containing protein [Sphingobacteriales bacterium]|nr:DUF547 domain-containing protein [Sphingobacteriales bacterium]